jgi:hypothetical protein
MPAKRRSGISRAFRSATVIASLSRNAARASKSSSLQNSKNRKEKAKRGQGYQLDEEDESESEDDETVIQDQKTLWDRIQRFEKELEDDPDAITISVKRLHQEAKLKGDRSARVSAGWRFFVFFGLYAAVMIIQKNADQSEKVASSLIDYLITSQYRSIANTVGTEWPDKLGPGMKATGCFAENCVEPSYLTKGYLDIMDVADFWDWMEFHLFDIIYKVRPRQPEHLQSTKSHAIHATPSRPATGGRFTLPHPTLS